MVDRSIEGLEQGVRLLLLLKAFVGGNVGKVDELTFFVVKD